MNKLWHIFKKSSYQSQGVKTLFYFLFFEFLKVSTSFQQLFNNIVTTFSILHVITPTAFHTDKTKNEGVMADFQKKARYQNIILFYTF